LPALLRRFPDLEITGPLVHRTGLALHGYRSVPVRTGEVS
jgi:hypothetical protein